MKPQMFADLNKAMEKFCDTEIDKAEIDFWESDDLALHMARAAEAVFDAAVSSSQFTANELRSVNNA